MDNINPIIKIENPADYNYFKEKTFSIDTIPSSSIEIKNKLIGLGLLQLALLSACP